MNANREFDCGECGQRVRAVEFHPYLYCELYKLGHYDQAAYLRDYGFVHENAAAR
jgi:hypothetical protein